jgi:hypothetical protein
MKKIIFINIILLLFISAGSYAFYYNFNVEEIPMQFISADVSNKMYGGFINIVNVGASANFNDNINFRIRIKDSFRSIPPVGITNTNTLYMDRFSFNYRSDMMNILAGRDLFLENNGLIIGNMADGVQVGLGYFNLKERLYILHSGLPGTMPKDVNQFYMSSYDYESTNGPERFTGGLVMEKMGLIGKSLSVMCVYSMDLTTNNIYNPLTLGVTAEGSIIPALSYAGGFYFQAGSMTSNTSISAWAFDASFIYMTGDAIKYGGTAELAIGSADSTNTTNSYEGFNYFGQYNFGFVKSRKLQNLIAFKIGGIGKLLEDTLSLKLDYIYTMRMSTNDYINTVLNSYTSNGTYVGSEVDLTANYAVDPNLSLFATCGFFLKGSAYESTTNDYKIIAGASLKF